jgi:hypothetical protein
MVFQTGNCQASKGDQKRSPTNTQSRPGRQNAAKGLKSNSTRLPRHCIVLNTKFESSIKTRTAPTSTFPCRFNPIRVCANPKSLHWHPAPQKILSISDQNRPKPAILGARSSLAVPIYRECGYKCVVEERCTDPASCFPQSMLLASHGHGDAIGKGLLKLERLARGDLLASLSQHELSHHPYSSSSLSFISATQAYYNYLDRQTFSGQTASPFFR